MPFHKPENPSADVLLWSPKPQIAFIKAWKAQLGAVSTLLVFLALPAKRNLVPPSLCPTADAFSEDSKMPGPKTNKSEVHGRS